MTFSVPKEMMISSIVSLRIYKPLNVLSTPTPKLARLSIRCNPKGNCNVPVCQTSKECIVRSSNSATDATRSLRARNESATSADSPVEVRNKCIRKTT